jgi:ABC-type lipoprotein export system ATPase subunit
VGGYPVGDHRTEHRVSDAVGSGDESGRPAVQLRDVFCLHRTNEGDAAALQGMTLKLGVGEVLCVLGPSGSGKSTLVRVIAGLQAPSAGEVDVLGEDIWRLSSGRRSTLRNERIGLVGQSSDALLSRDLTVAQAIALPLALRGVARRRRLARVRELLGAAALTERGSALPAELSGGERQRVSLCMALAHRPRLLLADEPTGELDETSARAMRELIVELTRANGATGLIVSHDPEMAAVADGTVRIRDGRVVEQRRDGEDALVIGPGGWIRLPQDLLRKAEIDVQVRVTAAGGGLMLTPVRTRGPGLIAGERGRVTVRRARRDQAVRDWSASRAQMRSVTFDYRRDSASRPLLDAVSVELAVGRMTAITGRSGSGKTTLLRLLAGLQRPDSGEVLLDGQSIQGLDAESRARVRRERIGYLPQEPTPVGFLSVEENVILALLLRGLDRASAAPRATEVLARTGLSELARQRVHRLSAGEAQRVALARALAGARGLLIVDEPTSRLDEANAIAVAELLAGAARDGGQTVICATHDGQVVRRAEHAIPMAAPVRSAPSTPIKTSRR